MPLSIQIDDKKIHQFPLAEFFLVSISLMLSAMGWVALQGGAVTWDTFNHHIYLGRQAIDGSRLLYDYFAAGSMSCQYPLGYVPLVALLDYGLSGTAIFQVLTFLAALYAPASWLIMWCVVPSSGKTAVLLRITGTCLAFSGVLWWKVLTQTSNDALGMSLSIWCVALSMLCIDRDRWVSRTRWRLLICILSGALAGLALVVKMTQFIGVLAALCILLFAETHRQERLKFIAFFGVTATAVAFATGWSWGLDSWRACGSPIYPFMLDYFQGFSLGVTP